MIKTDSNGRCAFLFLYNNTKDFKLFFNETSEQRQFVKKVCNSLRIVLDKEDALLNYLSTEMFYIMHAYSWCWAYKQCGENECMEQVEMTKEEFESYMHPIERMEKLCQLLNCDVEGVRNIMLFMKKRVESKKDWSMLDLMKAIFRTTKYFSRILKNTATYNWKHFGYIEYECDYDTSEFLEKLEQFKSEDFLAINLSGYET